MATSTAARPQIVSAAPVLGTTVAPGDLGIVSAPLAAEVLRDVA